MDTNGWKSPWDWLREDVLKSAAAATIVAFATGLSGAVISGAWQAALLAVSGIAVVILVVILVAAAVWQTDELGKVAFEEKKALHASQTQEAKFHREQAGHLFTAATTPRDMAGRIADHTLMLERCRRFASACRAGSFELLLFSEDRLGTLRVLAQAGLFDLAVLSDSARLVEWIDQQGACAYGCAVRAPRGSLRVLAIRDAQIDDYDRALLQSFAKDLTALALAHELGDAGQMEVSA